jgi:hypothetical protein
MADDFLPNGFRNMAVATLTTTDAPSEPKIETARTGALPEYRLDRWGWPIETFTSWSRWRKFLRYLLVNVQKALY